MIMQLHHTLCFCGRLFLLNSAALCLFMYVQYSVLVLPIVLFKGTFENLYMNITIYTIWKSTCRTWMKAFQLHIPDSPRLNN